MCVCYTTVDGSEIRRSPVDMVDIPLFTAFYTCQVVIAGFLPSTVFTMVEIAGRI